MFSKQNRINFEINNLKRFLNIWKLRHFQTTPESNKK